MDDNDSLPSAPPTPTSNSQVSTPLRTRTPQMRDTPMSIAGTPVNSAGVLGTPARSVAGSYRGADSPTATRSILRTPGSVHVPRGGLGMGGSAPPTPLTIGTVRQEDEDSVAVAPQVLEDGVQDQAVIWGTNIRVPEAAAAFREFLLNFKSIRQSERANHPIGDGDLDDDLSIGDEDEHEQPLYVEQLQQIRREQSGAVQLDCQHLFYHSPACQKLYHQLVQFPQEIVPLMDLLVNHEYERLAVEATRETEDGWDDEEAANGINTRIQVRPFHLKSISHMRALDPNCIDSLVALQGMVVRSSPIIPDLKVGFFQCAVCGFTKEVSIDKGKITEPTNCTQCQTKHSFMMVHNRCIFADKQMVRLQETPDEVPAGETPASIVLFAFDSLVDTVRPGDRVEVTGVYRAQPKRVNPRQTKVRSIYKTYIDVIHFRIMENGEVGNKSNKMTHSDDLNGSTDRLNNKSGWNNISTDRLAEMKRLSKLPDIYDRLTRALAPSIWELDDVKKGILCMLFGGNSRRVKNMNGPTDSGDISDDESLDGGEGSPNHQKLAKRGDINILLCGDPGTSKSQLLSFVNKLSPRGVYTSGKGSSAVGLTASVVRDPETRELVLESGALVLSDLGVCCIDEFDKMSDTTRAILHEAMEQQTVSIAKAGIICSLNARASILASANPKESRYNPRMSVVDNIKLPPTLLSRFDLIYLILDQPNADSDRLLAKHLVGLYNEEVTVSEPPMEQSLLRDYISYAREHVHPAISDLAARELINGYLEMRRMGGNSKTISATPRQLESLIRLSEGLAKMRFSEVVTRRDVNEAVRLMRVATQAAATDPRTGKIDMDMITTGRTQVDRESADAIGVVLKELLTERRGTRMVVGDVRKQLNEIMNVQLQQEEVTESLRQMDADGIVQLNERAQTIFVKSVLI